MNILLVDDELLIAEMLKEMLQNLGHSVVGIAKNYNQAVTILERETAIDLCFLDINLQAEKSGFDVAQLINERFYYPFVFLTSYSDKKMIEDAIKFKPEAYIIKPFSEPDLFSTIELIKSRKKIEAANLETKSIIIKDGTLSFKIDVLQIQWITSDDVYVEIITNEKKYLVRNSISRLLEEINEACFVRTHRAFAVNIHHVKGFNGQYLLVGDEKIPCSRKHRDEVMEQLKQL